MVQDDRPGLHLIGGAVLDHDPPPEVRASGVAERWVRSAVRAARPVLDGLERREREAIAAVVVSHVGGESLGMGDIARRVQSCLALGASLPLTVAGHDACVLFTAMHVAQALVRNLEDARVLLISLGASATGAFLFADDGGVVCKPLPPTRARLGDHLDPGADEVLYGLALALAVERSGLRRCSIGRVASPGVEPLGATRVAREAGLAHALTASNDTRLVRAATAEALLVLAAQAPPVAPTLCWTRADGGHVDGCIIAPPADGRSRATSRQV